MGPVLDVIEGGPAGGGADLEAPIPWQTEWVRRTYFPTTVSWPAATCTADRVAHTITRGLDALGARP